MNSGSFTDRSSSQDIKLDVILTSPQNGVNLTALANRFKSTYYNLGLSNPISIREPLFLFRL